MHLLKYSSQNPFFFHNQYDFSEGKGSITRRIIHIYNWISQGVRLSLRLRSSIPNLLILRMSNHIQKFKIQLVSEILQFKESCILIWGFWYITEEPDFSKTYGLRVIRRPLVFSYASKKVHEWIWFLSKTSFLGHFRDYLVSLDPPGRPQASIQKSHFAKEKTQYFHCL